MGLEFGKRSLESSVRDLGAALDVVRAVHEHFRLDDRHDSGFLAQGRIARQRVGVGVNAEIARHVRIDIDDGAPLGELRTEFPIPREAFAQPVESLGNLLAGIPGQRLGALVDLDARNHVPLGEIHGKRRAVRRALAQGLVEQDHAADVVCRAGRREEHLPVAAAVFLCRFGRDRVEPLLDRRRAFVRRKDAPARRNHCASHGVQLPATHQDLHWRCRWITMRGESRALGRQG